MDTMVNGDMLSPSAVMWVPDSGWRNPSHAAPIFAKPLVEGDSAVGISVKFVKECLHSIFVDCLSLGTHLYLYTVVALLADNTRTPYPHCQGSGKKTHSLLPSKSCRDCNVVSIQPVNECFFAIHKTIGPHLVPLSKLLGWSCLNLTEQAKICVYMYVSMSA